jgi:hypothetical protein
VSVVVCSSQKRAPSDGKILSEGLVAVANVEGTVKHHVRKLSALLASLGVLITLALAGGASLKGW